MKKIFIFLSTLIISCSSTEKLDTSTPEGAFRYAERFEEAKRFEEAILRYQEVRNRFPYSNLAIEAQLKVADIQFQREYYIEAASSYQIFRELNPRYPRMEYVIYRIAISFYRQLPKTIDRDLSASQEAIKYFDEYINRFPQGTWLEEIYQAKLDTVTRLAQKEMYIGDFYFKRKQWFSALGRYQGLYEKYSFLDEGKTAAFKAFESAIELDYKDIAAKFLDILKKRYPDSKEYQQATKKGASIGIL